MAWQRSFKTETLVKEPSNETIVYDHYTKGVEFVELFCPGKYLYKNSKETHLEVKFNVTALLIAAIFKTEGDLKKNKILFITSALLSNSTNK